ncbi:hypothetical protein NE237_011680 [Protea cynaroides]|uniref:Uncharacterized protein n=1 Tax=Protea cynaroides TaxID=273540 RepID=A0A9Q0GZL0_9MAGN|nr:hypothetical protein NE237_011680 [Protea cynaroides]
MEETFRQELGGDSFCATWTPDGIMLEQECGGKSTSENIWMKSGDATIVPHSSGELKLRTDQKKELQKRGEKQNRIPPTIVAYNYFDQRNVTSKHMYENQKISASDGGSFDDLSLGSFMKMK